MAVAGEAASNVPPPERNASCTLAQQSGGAVIEVIDGATLRLSDGAVVRLAGIIAPTAPLAVKAQGTPWPPEDAAKTALAQLVANATVIEIAVADQKQRTDRYGRTLAHVIVTKTGGSIWLQGALLKAGHARASSFMAGGICLTEMLALEHSARLAGHGVWSNPAYRVIDANDTTALKRQRTSFAIVEGTVASVSARADRTYLNFGRDWKWDFTASVPKGLIKDNPEVVARLQSRAGQRVRVRGWLDLKNGPMIEIGDLAEIEDIGDTAAAK